MKAHGRLWLFALMASACLLSFQNCGSFKPASPIDGSSIVAPTASPPASTTPPGSGTPSTSGTTPPAPSAAGTPTIHFSALPCHAGTECVATYTLSGPTSSAIEFDWQTNDARYGQTPPAGAPPFGQPGVDYVSKTGHVAFTPGGALTAQTTVQNIETDPNKQITISVLLGNCTVAGQAVNCADLFK